MKIFKSSILVMAALMGAAFTACSDDDKYEPASQVDGVYFTTNDLSIVYVDPEETGFTVQIGREGSTAAATYSLVGTVAEDAAGKFTLPKQVTFAEGEKLAKVTVNCALDVDDLEKTYSMTMGFADGTPLNPWGYETYDFSVTVRAIDPLKYWKPVGYAYVIDGWIMSRFKSVFSGNPSLEDLAWDAVLYENISRPGKYRIENMWTDGYYIVKLAEAGFLEIVEDRDIYVDCTNEECVKIEPQASGIAIEIGEDGMVEVSICNIAGLYASRGLTDEEIINRIEENGMEQCYIEDGFIYVYPCLFGYNGDIGYEWSDHPEGALLFEYSDDPAGAPAKKSALSLSMKNGKVDLSRYAKFASAIN